MIGLILKNIFTMNIIISAIFFGGCAKSEVRVETTEIAETVNSEETVNDTDSETEMTTGDEETWKLLGEEIRKLDDIPDIDEAAIYVNGQVVTKKEIEIEKINAQYLKNFSLSERLQTLFRNKICKAEAIHLNIEPSQESIDTYLKQTLMTLNEKAVGTEVILAYLEGLGVTTEEYIVMLEKTAYDMYQREALRAYVETSGKGKSYEQYVDELAENAEIKVSAPEYKDFLQFCG